MALSPRPGAVTENREPESSVNLAAFSRLWIAALIVILSGAGAAQAAMKSTAQGRKYYLRYCASCHGVNGDGLGPAASSLKVQPTDLRTLSEKYGTPLPIDQLARFIDGREYVAAHGSREMPVWGERFYDIWSADQSHKGGMKERIRKIILYLRTIQKKPGVESPIGSKGLRPGRNPSAG